MRGFLVGAITATIRSFVPLRLVGTWKDVWLPYKVCDVRSIKYDTLSDGSPCAFCRTYVLRFAVPLPVPETRKINNIVSLSKS